MGRCSAVVALGLAVFLGLGAARAEAATGEADVVAALLAEGYQRVHVEHTWLGRIRIVGWLDGRMREIVLHPTSGEVLRDYLAPPVTVMADGDHGPTGAPADNGGGAAEAVISLTVGEGDGEAAGDPGASAALDPASGPDLIGSDDGPQP